VTFYTPLSIVTVVKDDDIGLQKTYNSLQRLLPFSQLLLITPFNDSSTHKAAFEISKKSPNVVLLEDDGVGIYPAMNKAVHFVDDECWVWYLNAGDTFPTTCDPRQFLSRLASVSSNWAYFAFNLYDEEERLLSVKSAPRIFSVKNQLFARNYVSHQATFMKGALLKRLQGFDPGYYVAADWDLLCRANSIEPPERVDLVVVDFFLGGYSTANRRRGNSELLKLREVHLPRNLKLISHLWYFYRYIRISLINSLDFISPKLIRNWRHLKVVLSRIKGSASS
jgi:hypothetical protein